MSRDTLTIERRDASGKSPNARRLRATGRVPGVVYHDKGNVTFSVDLLEASKVLRKGSTLIDADLDGTKQLTVVKDYQQHPVRGTLMHIDLQAVSMNQKVKLTVSLLLVGEAEGVKNGGVLSQGTTEVLIECTPAEIPDAIEVDVSALDLGDSLSLADIAVPSGVTLLDDLGNAVASVTMPRGLTAAEEAGEVEGEEGAEGEAADGEEAADGGDGDAAAADE